MLYGNERPRWERGQKVYVSRWGRKSEPWGSSPVPIYLASVTVTSDVYRGHTGAYVKIDRVLYNADSARFDYKPGQIILYSVNDLLTEGSKNQLVANYELVTDDSELVCNPKAFWVGRELAGDGRKDVNCSLLLNVTQSGEVSIDRHIGQMPQVTSRAFIFSTQPFYTPWGERVMIEVRARFDSVREKITIVESTVIPLSSF